VRTRREPVGLMLDGVVVVLFVVFECLVAPNYLPGAVARYRRQHLQRALQELEIALACLLLRRMRSSLSEKRATAATDLRIVSSALHSKIHYHRHYVPRVIFVRAKLAAAHVQGQRWPRLKCLIANPQGCIT
jgi:hypothetical protein